MGCVALALLSAKEREKKAEKCVFYKLPLKERGRRKKKKVSYGKI
jgi:hypothetical protein